jgi:UDP-N-acetyl-D-mannosaminuronic acid dehydrogenase
MIGASVITKSSVCIIGVGYIGLPTALLAAKGGFNVHAYDTNEHKIAQLNQGLTAIREEDLAKLLKESVTSSLLTFDTQPLPHADFYIIAVPTPFLETKQADVSYVWNAIQTICPLLKPGASIIIESTIPVFLTDAIATFVKQHTGFIAGKDVFISHCPERVLPGNMLHELINNDRVLGGVTPACAQQAAIFYKAFVTGALHITTAKSAELVKLIENSSRDVQIALANQVDQMCTTAGVDSREIIALANQHPRVKLLQPGPGVGGHCIAVDPWFLINAFPQSTQLLLAARKINDERPNLVLSRIKTALDKMLHESPTRHINIGIWGLTFKPNVDDIRQSPALEIAEKLLNLHNPRITFHAVEPNVHPHLIQSLGFVAETEAERSLEFSDGVIVLVKHSAFTNLSPTLLKQKIVLDACGLLYESTKKQQQEKINLEIQPAQAPHKTHSPTT